MKKVKNFFESCGVKRVTHRVRTKELPKKSKKKSKINKLIQSEF